jgi:hypothetical protein
VVEVDGRRAGYIGPNPLSGNLEYFVQPWARGGVGTAVVAGYLSGFRAGDRPRTFFVSAGNDRSLATLLAAFERLGWSEGTDYRIEEGRHGRRVRVPRSTSTAVIDVGRVWPSTHGHQPRSGGEE